MIRCCVVFCVAYFVAVAGDICYYDWPHYEAWTVAAEVCGRMVTRGASCSSDFRECVNKITGYGSFEKFVAFLSTFAREEIKPILKTTTEPCRDKFPGLSGTKFQHFVFLKCLWEALKPVSISRHSTLFSLAVRKLCHSLKWEIGLKRDGGIILWVQSEVLFTSGAMSCYFNLQRTGESSKFCMKSAN